VVGDLLAGARSVHDRTAREPIPRRTWQSIRQRLIARDVIKERYVPDPAVLGRPLVTFALAQPYAERRAEAIALWRGQGGASHVCAFRTALFGIFFLSGPEDLNALRTRLAQPQVHQDLYFLECDSREPSVPVFWDFEAAWAQVTGLPGTLAYPHPLPSSPQTPGNLPQSSANADREAVRSLVAEPPEAGSKPRSERWIGRLSRGNRESRLLREGKVEFRSFLDPLECSRWADNFPDAVMIVRGTLLSDAAPAALFRALVEECGVSPFLFATNHEAVLLAALSDRRTGSGRARASRRTPPLAVMQQFLRQIVVLREPLDTLTMVVDHRYDWPAAEAV